MRRMVMFWKVLVLAVVTTSLVGCGEASDPPAAMPPDTAVSNTPGPGRPGDGGPQRVEPSEGLVDVRATTFDRSERRAGGRALDLYFWSGIEECYGVDRVEVAYREKVVSLTIFEGRRPEAETCIELAVRKVIRVELDEPIGSRKIVDGGAAS